MGLGMHLGNTKRRTRRRMEGGSPMSGTTIDWDEAQKRRNKKHRVTDIARDLGCHTSHVYRHTKMPGGSRPQGKRVRAKSRVGGIPLHVHAAAAYSWEGGKVALALYLDIRFEWQNVALFLRWKGELARLQSGGMLAKLTPQRLAEYFEARGLSQDALEFAAWYPKQVGLPLPPEWSA